MKENYLKRLLYVREFLIPSLNFVCFKIITNKSSGYKDMYTHKRAQRQER